MRKRDTLIGQVLAANVLLITGSLFAASLVGGFDFTSSEGRSQFLVLALAVCLTLVVNILVLRRRFYPLDKLIKEIEQVDPARPEKFAGSTVNVEEIQRLSASFSLLLDRIAAERNRSTRLVMRAQEEERRRLARDLHDEVNQALTGVLLRLEALRQDAGPELERELGEVKALATQAMQELITLARQLRPTALDDHGLVPAIAGQVRRFSEATGIHGELTTRGELDELDPDQETTLYRVAQEALSNIARHSGASEVEVELTGAPSGSLVLRVSDDGRGFATRNGNGIGLEGMSERARLVGGELSVESRAGEGTRVVLRIP
ncbi:MAG: sensor histidine kinase [Thermoleophilaceae bacterium]|nr:sensor histidine kinase [Thermoleophilaceae bacterium]